MIGGEEGEEEGGEQEREVKAGERVVSITLVWNPQDFKIHLF